MTGAGVIGPLKAKHHPYKTSPERVTVRGRNLLDHTGTPTQFCGFSQGRFGASRSYDAVDNKAQGANCVRLPLRWWGYYVGTWGSNYSLDSRLDTATSTGRINPLHLAWLDSMVTQYEAAGIWMILFFDSNCGQNGLQNSSMASYCDPSSVYPNGHNFWSDPVAQEYFIQAWEFLVTRYRTRRFILAWELLPEPNPPGVPQALVTAFYIKLMLRLRALDPVTPFLIGSTDAYNIKTCADAYVPNSEAIIYTGNLYINPGNTKTPAVLAGIDLKISILVSFGFTMNVPTLIQQVGVRSGDDPYQIYQAHLLRQMVKYGMSFCWWEYLDTVTDPTQYGVWYDNGAGGYTLKPDVLGQCVTWFAQCKKFKGFT